MLNKQGIFNRRSEPDTPPPAAAAGAVNGLNRSAPSAILPGHLAALESTTSSSASAAVNTAAAKPAAENNTETETPSGSRLIVGPNVVLKGAEIQNCDTLVVEGRVEATMDSRVLQIAEKGAFSGNVGIDVAEIYGEFDGELTARTQLIIHATGRVSGKIRYGKILIEAGGELSGDIASLASEQAKPTGLRTAVRNGTTA